MRMKTFGEQLNEARTAIEMTQEQLAETLGVTRQGVSNWERGRSVPEKDMIERISGILNCEFEISEEPETEKQQAIEETVQPVEQNHSVRNERKKTEKMVRRKTAWVMTAVGFIAGLLVMLLVLQVIVPAMGKPEQLKVGEQPNVPKNSVEWFKAERSYPDDGAKIEVSFNASPVYPVVSPDDPDGYVWFYTEYATEVNGYDFVVESYEEYFFNGDEVASVFTYSVDHMVSWWGENRIRANGQTFVNGGLPLQDMTGIGIRIAGKDASGEFKEFYGYVELSSEIPEELMN